MPSKPQARRYYRSRTIKTASARVRHKRIQRKHARSDKK